MKANFSWERSAEQYAALYAKLLPGFVYAEEERANAAE